MEVRANCPICCGMSSPSPPPLSPMPSPPPQNPPPPSPVAPGFYWDRCDVYRERLNFMRSISKEPIGFACSTLSNESACEKYLTVTKTSASSTSNARKGTRLASLCWWDADRQDQPDKKCTASNMHTRNHVFTNSVHFNASYDCANCAYLEEWWPSLDNVYERINDNGAVPLNHYACIGTSADGSNGAGFESDCETPTGVYNLFDRGAKWCRTIMPPPSPPPPELPPIPPNGPPHSPPPTSPSPSHPPPTRPPPSPSLPSPSPPPPSPPNPCSPPQPSVPPSPLPPNDRELSGCNELYRRRWIYNQSIPGNGTVQVNCTVDAVYCDDCEYERPENYGVDAPGHSGVWDETPGNCFAYGAQYPKSRCGDAFFRTKSITTDGVPVLHYILLWWNPDGTPHTKCKQMYCDPSGSDCSDCAGRCEGSTDPPNAISGSNYDNYYAHEHEHPVLVTWENTYNAGTGDYVGMEWCPEERPRVTVSGRNAIAL
mgnify:CR=1 FL=1